MNKPQKKSFISRLWPLALIVLGLLLALYFRLDNYLDYSLLQSHHQQLVLWTQAHYLSSVLLFMLIYCLSVAISIPGATILTLIGGFLFGVFWGTIYVVLSATLGASLLFFAVKTAFAEGLNRQASGWVERMRQGFQEDAFSYLLVLRLLPIFPFWAVNLVPALLNIKTKTYVTATLIGILPGSFVFVLLGNGLSHLLELNQRPDLGIILSWQILLPLIGLALLSLLPVLYKRFYRRDSDKNLS